MVKIIMSKLNNNFYIFLILIFIALNACGKKDGIERPPLDNNLEPAIVEENK